MAQKGGPDEEKSDFEVLSTGTRVHFVIFVIFIKIKYFPF